MEEKYNPYTREFIDTWHEDLTRHVSGLVKQCGDYFVDYDNITVLDVGSNTGRFIEMLNDKVPVKNAILVDAIDELVEYSKEILHDVGDFSYESVALGNEENTLAIYFSIIADGVEPNLGTAKLHTDGHRDVTVTKFDTLWKSKYRNFKPDLIKIDAEGYDIRVIQGMRKFIEYLAVKPMIIYELAGLNMSDEEREQIRKDLQFLTDMGYESYWHDGDLTPPFSCDVAMVMG